MTIDSKNHLVAPAVSTDDYPVIQQDAHRRLSKEEQQSLDLATEEEREKARTIVSRLHVELGHSGPRGMIDSLRRRHAHRLIIAAAKKFSCSALRRKSETKVTVAARDLHEPGTCLQVATSSAESTRVGNHHGGSRVASVTHPQSHGR